MFSSSLKVGMTMLRVWCPSSGTEILRGPAHHGDATDAEGDPHSPTQKAALDPTGERTEGGVLGVLDVFRDFVLQGLALELVVSHPVALLHRPEGRIED